MGILKAAIGEAENLLNFNTLKVLRGNQITMLKITHISAVATELFGTLAIINGVIGATCGPSNIILPPLIYTTRILRGLNVFWKIKYEKKDN